MGVIKTRQAGRDTIANGAREECAMLCMVKGTGLLLRQACDVISPGHDVPF